MYDNKRVYPCNREYEKIIKYNGQMYKLRSVFDDATSTDIFDFNLNKELFDIKHEYDFNKVIELSDSINNE